MSLAKLSCICMCEKQFLSTKDSKPEKDPFFKSKLEAKGHYMPCSFHVPEMENLIWNVSYTQSYPQ